MAASKLSQNGCHIRGSPVNIGMLSLGRRLTLYPETVFCGGVVAVQSVGGCYGVSSM